MWDAPVHHQKPDFEICQPIFNFWDVVRYFFDFVFFDVLL